MKTQTMEKLIWTLIYGGLLGVALGLSVQRSNDALGWGIAVLGGVVAAVGAVLIYARSRMGGERK